VPAAWVRITGLLSLSLAAATRMPSGSNTRSYGEAAFLPYRFCSQQPLALAS
jgi:hypothetical protein